MVAVAIFFALPHNAFGAVPIVDTTIEIRKTGSEPFNTSDGDDDCTDGNTFDTANTFTDGSAVDDGDNGADHDGKDACADNDVVRLSDSVTYKVEISVNDSDVDYLTSTVTLDPYDQSTLAPSASGTIHQEWITIPSGCEEDPLLVTPISELQDLDGDGYNETLFCNQGFAREGTNKVFFPAAKVIGTATDGTKATLNDSIVGASVSAQGISSSAATGNNGTSATESDGPAEALVTADFRVNLTKEMVGFSYDSDGNPIWPKLDEKDGPAGEEGYLALFDVKAVYQKGSMIADSPDELSDTDGDGFLYDADYDILDLFTDDSDGNDGTFSSDAQLYTWDSASPACAFNGDNGIGATVTCTQTDYPIDWSGPSFVPDGTDDVNMHIDIDNVDTRDPDGDGTLFNVRVGIWIPKSDVDSHPTCDAGTCQYFHINEAQALDTDTSAIAEFSPVSTEDSGGNNLDNYGTGSEPGGIGSPDEHTANSDNITNGLLVVSSPGTWTYRKTFQRTADNVTNTPKLQEQLRAKGEVLPMTLNIYDYRLIDGGKSQICDKIDTSQYEFAGVPAWDKWPKYPAKDGPFIGNFWDGNGTTWPQPTQNNPSLRIWGGSQSGTVNLLVDGAPVSTSLYSNTPNGTGSLVDLDTVTCEDDVDGDGNVVILDAGGNLVDEDGNATTGTPDWYEDYAMVPLAVDGTSGVTKIRFEYIYDKEFADAQYALFGGQGHQYTYNSIIYDLKVRDDATGYGAKLYMPNYADARRSDSADNETWLAWQDNATDAVQDPTNVSFGYNIYSADRNILVPSGIAVGKKTVPEGLKVVRGGDVVQFEITPTVFGLWSGTETADVIDNLPPGTDYIGGSEEFSIDGGATWLDYAAYVASSPDVTLTSAGTPSAQDPITWSFGSLDAGDQMPQIRYKVEVDVTLTSGNFKNTVTFSAPNIAADKLTVDTDDDGVGDAGDGVGDDVTASYQLTILPKYGFDVLKQVSKEVYNVNENFIFDLTYKNLGGESYTGGDFIDILPFEGDALTTIGGIDSVRNPATDYNGIYTFESASFANGEVFWVTDEDPATLNLDPCASSNRPSGYVPAVGDLCHQDYINNGNLLPDGVAAGTDSANWQACTPGASPLDVAADCPIAPIDVTAVRFQPPSIPTSGGKVVSLELKPLGNFGGDPVYTVDANGVQVVDWANSPDVGDIYTNSFGGRIPEISLNVISNDVSVTPVWGDVGGELWWDSNDDGTGQGVEEPIAGIELAILDASGNPVWIDPATGVTISDVDKAAYEVATGTTLDEYTVITGTDGSYSFENLPAGDYSIQVVDIPGNETWDLDDGLAAADSIADFTLGQETDPITGNILGVEDRDDVDFGYIPYLFDVELQKSIITPAPYFIGQEVEFQIIAENKGPDPVSDLEVTDTATGLTYVAASEVATQGTYAAGVWTVGDLASAQTETLNIKYTITAANLTDPVFNFAQVTSDGDFGSDIDSQPDDNISGTGPDDEESDTDLASGTDTHDDEAGVPLTLVAAPGIEITKTAGNAADGAPYIISADGTVTFTYVIENTGGIDLADMTITDDAGTPADATDDVTLTSTECADLTGPLAPDATVTCTADLMVDMADSPYANSASTQGVPSESDGTPIAGVDNPTDDDPAEVLAPPAIAITKTAGDAADSTDFITNDDKVTFTYLVQNTGGTYLTDMTITDDAGTPADATDDVTLASAECADLAGPLAPSGTVTCTTTLPVASLNYTNSAGISGTPSDADGNDLTSGDDTPLFDDPEDDDDAIVLKPAISLDKSLYEGHDGGVLCDTGASVDELTIVDKEKSDRLITYCFVVENTGPTVLTLFDLTDPVLEIDEGDMTVLSGDDPLAPGQKRIYYYETDSNTSIDNTAAIEAVPADEDGNPVDTDPVSDTDSNALLIYVADPPFGEKVGTLEGRDIINWDMVWINDSEYLAAGVIIRDEPPVDTEYNGNVTCNGAGSTVVQSCSYLGPDATYPRGHVEVVADIAPDPGVSRVENAANALTISFDVLITTTETTTFENQAELEWDADGDGISDFSDVSDNPNTGDLGDITTVPYEGLACQEYEHEDIEGYIYIDEDRDGKKDDDEDGIENVTVYLKDENGNVIAETETDSDGMYKFGKYPPGKYTIDLKTSDKDLRGYTITNEDGDTNDLNGIDQINHRCDDNSDVDFGYLKTGNILAKTGTNLLLWIAGVVVMFSALLVGRRALRTR